MVHRTCTGHLWVVLVLVFGLPLIAFAEEEQTAAWEKQVQGAIAKSRPTVVAVQATMPTGPPLGRQAPEVFASGVIISTDGLILSQCHVTHPTAFKDPTADGEVGSVAIVILHDGTRHEAIKLGADPAHDISLLQLTQPGPWPHAPLDRDLTLSPGDDVLKLGFPGGYQQGIPASVRAGRVVQAAQDRFVTDCLVIGGDSGGPFFDLDGQLVGILQNSAAPSSVFVEAAKVARRSFHAGATPNVVIADAMEQMKSREIVQPDADATHDEQMRGQAVLPGEQWTQGSNRLTAARHVVAPLRPAAVRIVDGERVVATGILVGEQGHVLTKASLLPRQPGCRLADGRLSPATVVGVHTPTDLALLALSDDPWFKGMDFGRNEDPQVGAWVAAVGAGELPLAVGIVSLPRRDQPGPFPRRAEPAPPVPATLPEVIGSAVQGRGYWVEFVEGRAAAAGILPGDVILRIAGVPIRSHTDLARCVENRWADERVEVELLRGAQPLSLSLSLRSRFGQSFRGRSDGFESAFEVDLPLLADDLGGVVVDRQGQVLGIAIGRGPVGCQVIPADRIAEVLPELKSGRLAEAWAASADTQSSAEAKRPQAAERVGQPADITVEALREALTKRQQQFQSLLVDYDVLSEAQVDPLQLMQWGLHNVRDYQEQHRIGFSGARRFTSVHRPAPQLEYVPADRLRPDPNAPPEIAQRVSNARRTAESRRARGDFDYLVAMSQPETIRTIFDGEQCFVWSEQQGRYNKAAADSFYGPLMYLANVGLRPVDPAPSDAARVSQQQYWLPSNFDIYDNVLVRDYDEFVDDVACVVVEGNYQQARGDKTLLITDTIWLDQQRGWTPLKREQRVDGVLVSQRANLELEEFAPGCWLPWKSTWSIYAPPWSDAEFVNQPAYSYHLTLRRASLNDDVSEEIFTVRE